MKKKTLLRYLFLGLVAALAASLWHPRKQKEEMPASHPRDYAAIAAEGILRAATEYNSIGFHAEGDTVSGFHYELIEAFARHQGLKAAVVPEMSFEQRLKGLAGGRFDIIACGILATSELKDSLLLTQPIVLSREVLVQRKPRTATDSARFVHSHLELAEKTLNVVKGSPSILRIHNLGEEIGDTIYIHEIERYGPEQLVALVAYGDIDYAVCNESIARALADSLPQIDISTAIGFTQFYSWGVSKHSPALLDSLNHWLKTFKQGKEFKRLYQKYYGH